MSRSIKAEVTRFNSATLKETEARGIRLQSVDALLTVHTLKPKAVSIALFGLADDAVLTSRETSPVSHAATVGRIARSLNIDPQEGAPYAILAELHKVATGTVKRAALDAAAANYAEKLAGSVPTLAEVEEFVTSLLDLKKSSAIGVPRNAGGVKDSDGEAADAKIDKRPIAIPATIGELIAALELQIEQIEVPEDRDAWIAAAKRMVTRATLKRNADVTKRDATVATAKAERATKGTKAPEAVAA